MDQVSLLQPLHIPPSLHASAGKAEQGGIEDISTGETALCA